MNIPQRRQRLRELGMQLGVLRNKIADVQDDTAVEWVAVPDMLGLLRDALGRDVGELQDALDLLDRTSEILDEIVKR